MTIFDVKWAAQHDWFIKSSELNNSIYRAFSVTVRNDTGDGVLEFTSSRELAEWAGY